MMILILKFASTGVPASKLLADFTRISNAVQTITAANMSIVVWLAATTETSCCSGQRREWLRLVNSREVTAINTGWCVDFVQHVLRATLSIVSGSAPRLYIYIVCSLHKSITRVQGYKSTSLNLNLNLNLNVKCRPELSKCGGLVVVTTRG